MDPQKEPNNVKAGPVELMDEIHMDDDDPIKIVKLSLNLARGWRNWVFKSELRRVRVDLF